MPAKRKLPNEKGRVGGLPGLPSLSVRQLAQRWRCSKGYVEDCIRTSVLRAYVLLHGVPGSHETGHHRQSLYGYFWLPPDSANDLLTKPRPKMTSSGSWPLYLIDRTGEEVAVDWRFVRRMDVRVLREDVERSATKGKTGGTKRKTALQRLLSEQAKKVRNEERTKRAPVHEAVREEFKRLRAEGYGRTKAALAIISDGASSQKIQAVAQREGVKPWRGDFYSLPGVLKIVGA